jgi:hypothetical protein
MAEGGQLPDQVIAKSGGALTIIRPALSTQAMRAQRKVSIALGKENPTTIFARPSQRLH